MEFLTDASAYWVWLVVGTVLLALEVSTGTLFLLWPGLSAFALAGVSWYFPGLSTPLQIFLFAAIGIALGVVGRGYLQLNPMKNTSDRPNLNSRSAQLIGRRVTAAEDFENGFGPVDLDDSRWRARVAEAETVVVAGAALKVTDVEGALLIVAPI